MTTQHFKWYCSPLAPPFLHHLISLSLSLLSFSRMLDTTTVAGTTPPPTTIHRFPFRPTGLRVFLCLEPSLPLPTPPSGTLATPTSSPLPLATAPSTSGTTCDEPGNPLWVIEEGAADKLERGQDWKMKPRQFSTDFPLGFGGGGFSTVWWAL